MKIKVLKDKTHLVLSTIKELYEGIYDITEEELYSISNYHAFEISTLEHQPREWHKAVFAAEFLEFTEASQDIEATLPKLKKIDDRHLINELCDVIIAYAGHMATLNEEIDCENANVFIEKVKVQLRKLKSLYDKYSIEDSKLFNAVDILKNCIRLNNIFHVAEYSLDSISAKIKDCQAQGIEIEFYQYESDLNEMSFLKKHLTDICNIGFYIEFLDRLQYHLLSRYTLDELISMSFKTRIKIIKEIRIIIHYEFESQRYETLY